MEREPNMQPGPFQINNYQHEPHNKRMQSDPQQSWAADARRYEADTMRLVGQFP